jgi:hypothetical protein
VYRLTPAKVSRHQFVRFGISTAFMPDALQPLITNPLSVLSSINHTFGRQIR